MLASDEKEPTLTSALSDLRKVWPQNAFYNSGKMLGLKSYSLIIVLQKRLLCSQNGPFQHCYYVHFISYKDSGPGYMMVKTKLSCNID